MCHETYLSTIHCIKQQCLDNKHYICLYKGMHTCVYRLFIDNTYDTTHTHTHINL